jgi:hypothetical protein
MKTALYLILLFGLFMTHGAHAACTYFVRHNIGLEAQSNAVFAGDFNNNNQNDLAVANNFLSCVTVFYDYNGNDFIETVHNPVGNSIYEITGADFNHDNDLDLAVTGYNPGCVYILTNYAGYFEVDTIDDVGDGICAIYTGDLNNDGFYDLATANFGSNDISILLNNGDGTFAAPVPYPFDYWPLDICGEDFDGDDDIDLAGVNSYYSQVSILMNNGDGTFAGRVDYPVPSDPRAVCSADFDGDDDLDLAVACMDSHRLTVLFNNGDGVFDDTLNYGQAYAIDLAAADLDGDLDMDIAVAGYGAVPGTGTVDVFRNSGDGHFYAPCIHYGAGSGARRLCIFDLDNDGDLDIPVANCQSEFISIEKNEPYVNGDVNIDGAINILDITFLISYVYMHGAEPKPPTSGSFNGDCAVNILDITYLIAYIYMNGPELICP